MVWTDLHSCKTSNSCCVAAGRKFYSYEGSFNNDAASEKSDEQSSLVQFVSENIIGSETVFQSPYGPRKVVYCDFTASGRSLQFIEDHMLSHVLPNYGSTHTTATHTAMQTTMFRHEARDVVRNAVRASERDRMIFTGSGATSAAVRLLHGLNLSRAPLVLAGPFLHHSALLPWREAGAKVIRIRESAEGSVDLDHLRQTLQQLQANPVTEADEGHGDRAQLIGCFSAASNVTGVLVDTVVVTMLLHEYGALAFWDYATAAPYVELDMNPVVLGDTRGFAHKDAMFFSLHKFVGGPQSPGVLVAKRSLFRHPVPALPGGGSIFFVSRSSHRFLQEEEEREEGGTPAILGDIRAGLVMQLKQAISIECIKAINDARVRRLKEFVSSTTNLVALGPAYPGSPKSSPARLPILSFMVRHSETGCFLHHNFVTALLNDLFGVQARGGCACAGPYALDLLGIDESLAHRYHQELAEPSGLSRHDLRRRHEYSDSEVLRPGFVRLGLSFTASDQEVEFVLRSVALVCQYGWRLLPQYICNHQTGEWKHIRQQVFKGRQWLGNVSYAGGRFSVRHQQQVREGVSYADCISDAHRIFSDAAKVARQLPDTSADQLILSSESQSLRWFVMPSEARRLLLEEDVLGRSSSPDTQLTDAANISNICELRSPACNKQNFGNSEEDCHIGPDVTKDETAFDIIKQSILASHNHTAKESECKSLTEPQTSDGSNSAPFNPPTYPLCESVLSSRPTYVWHQVPRLHYWPVQTSENKVTVKPSHAKSNGDTAGANVSLTSALRDSGNSVVAHAEGNIDTSHINSDKYVENHSANQIEMNVQHLSLSDGFPSGQTDDNVTGLNIQNNFWKKLHLKETERCDGEQEKCMHESSMTEMKKDLLPLNPSLPASESQCRCDGLVVPNNIDDTKTVNSDFDDTKTANCEKNVSHTATNSAVYVKTGSDKPRSSKKEANLSIKTQTTPKNKDGSVKNEGLEKGTAVRDFNSPTLTSSKAETVNFKGKNISSRAQDALRVRKKSPEGKKIVCQDMTCFLPRPDGDLPQLQLKAKWHAPPKHLFNPMVEAMELFKMIKDGDRVLLCLSGGKDSLSLLHLLHQYQFYARSRGVRYELGAVTVDPESAAYDPRPLIPYLSHLGVPYLFEQQGILQQALNLPDLNSICSFCSRMKRGRIYAAARAHGYNVLAFGQHLDDLAESFLMSAFHNGRLRTMKAAYHVQEGDLRVIRPLVFVREKHLRQFAESRHLPVIPENCPACFEVPKERHRSKQLLAQQELLFPQVYWSLRTALLPLMAIAGTGIENAVFGKNGALVNALATTWDNNDKEL